MLGVEFISAIYDDTSTLLAVRTKSETLKRGINEISLDTINSKAESDVSYFVKVYMWNSFEGMEPLTNTIIKNISRCNT